MNVLNRSFLLLAVLFFLVMLGIFVYSLFLQSSPSLGPDFQSVSPKTVIAYYVSPSGDDNNNGKSVSLPFKTIQKAVDLAQPGETIQLAPGIYLQDVVTKRDGKKDAPIVISGPTEAIVQGGGRDRIFEIHHNNIFLQGFTVNGHFSQTDSTSGYRSKLLYIQGKGVKAGVTGLKITGMTIKNSAGECVRLRYFAQNNEVSHNNIQNCGVDDFLFNGGGKNGEGIYIGTAPEQLKDRKNPTADPDQSNNNWIHDNNINTQGNECVDIKEASSGNIVENNKCTGQMDPKSGGMDSRGSKNSFRNNIIFGNLGAGIRLGGDKITDGIDNNVYGNIIKDNQSGGIKFERITQGKICSNIMSGNIDGNTVGTFGILFKPTSNCPN
ncbi:MAG: DUF1565 domain-containing protein [bacterium]|nr:DUF1565 domain-containing protein [bacterium]